ncbi:hypothetical protein EIN_387260 [Entamoeba invadens IP1]|uniref:Uncharacterized protein n=1 Tax=Entamoeba invadens IP1 TaxID=370355 RepID=A0A0A1UAE7_ENTIV|nr:hypothetical protein EIN_387260 [Entamoeba invadens IP1]ELP92002.1 hypothetical protein EIN_387260 [Entamoeba invadens IP1]|eukprot:XP_004258773.1 hypothetical protein EIN_387260 [Entamoeba invadens IP1]
MSQHDTTTPHSPQEQTLPETKDNSNTLNNQPQPSQKKSSIFKESKSPFKGLYGSTPLFQNLEYNNLTRDLREKYGKGIVLKGDKNADNDMDVSEAINILVTMVVCAMALGFVGYGYGGVVYAGLGAAIGIFLGMIADTLLVIIYSSDMYKKKHQKQKNLKIQPKRPQNPNNNEHPKTD